MAVKCAPVPWRGKGRLLREAAEWTVPAISPRPRRGRQPSGPRARCGMPTSERVGAGSRDAHRRDTRPMPPAPRRSAPA